jgi:protoheme IX farnesyltransferase
MKTAVAAPAAVVSARLADYLQLVRPRMAVMILLTVLIGGLLAAVGPAPMNTLLHAVISTGLVACGASALNQWLERDSDALMTRTKPRPLPAGRMSAWEVLSFGAALSVVGLAYQWVTLPMATFALTAFTLVSYVAVYTPAKQRTNLNTLIGAIPGALPPAIGWTAVRGYVDQGAVLLFLIVFFWQIPHFLAIAWMYRDEYARAGHRMLTVDDATGQATARQMFIYLLALVPVSLLAVGANVGGIIGAVALSVFYLRPIVAFQKRPSVATARAVLKSSLVYLPCIFSLLLVAKWGSIL